MLSNSMVSEIGMCIRFKFYFSREDIAAKSGRWTSQECFDHFNYFYLRGQLATVVARTTIAPNFITDHTSPAPAPQKPQVLSIDPIEQQLLGYMSVRDDFERVHFVVF